MAKNNKPCIDAEFVVAGDKILHPLTCKPVKVTQTRRSNKINHVELQFEKAKTLSMWTTTSLQLV